jgi:hypothetical protein
MATGGPYGGRTPRRGRSEIVYLCQNPAEAGHIRQRQACEREDEPISPEEEEQRAQEAEAAGRQRAERAETRTSRVQAAQAAPSLVPGADSGRICTDTTGSSSPSVQSP